jgi:hypothetical protein
MKALPVPLSHEDDAYLRKICDNPEWSIHYVQWATRYDAYRSNGGNPWVVPEVKFVPDVSVEQRQLYENRKSTSRFSKLRKMQLSSCPMCGSPVTGTLDHFLPKEIFPEFSVMAANLVPACGHCNSHAKGSTYKGTIPDERLIHPYFDTITSGDVWEVRILPPYDAATFEAVPHPNLDAPSNKRIVFHLQAVLGDQFQRAMQTAWATLPQTIRNEVEATTTVSIADVYTELSRHLRYYIVSMGRICWYAAFYRGLLRDVAAQQHIVHTATSLAISSIVL